MVVMHNMDSPRSPVRRDKIAYARENISSVAVVNQGAVLQNYSRELYILVALYEL